MANQNLFFNILTFEPKNEELTFYFTTDERVALELQYFSKILKH